MRRKITMQRSDFARKLYPIIESNPVRIGILDNGLLKSYFDDRIFNYQYYSINGQDNPLGEHGSTVADIIYNFLPCAEFYIYQVMDDQGYGKMSDVLEAFKLADRDQCRIINCSFSTSDIKSRPVFDEIVLYFKKKSVFLVTSMLASETYPAWCSDSIRAAGSEIIFHSGISPHFIVNTPIQEIYSHYDRREAGSSSYAAAFVSGLIGLILNHFPNLNYPDALKMTQETLQVIQGTKN